MERFDRTCKLPDSLKKSSWMRRGFEAAVRVRIYNEMCEWNYPPGMIAVIRRQNPSLTYDQVWEAHAAWCDAALGELEGTAAWARRLGNRKASGLSI